MKLEIKENHAGVMTLNAGTLILPFLRQLTYKVKLDFFSGQLAGKEI